MSGNAAFGYAALAIAAGAVIPVMAALSGAMGRTLGSPGAAALVVAVGGAIVVLAYTLLSGGGPALAQLGRASPPQVLSGLGVGFYLVSITFLAPRFGVGNAVMFVVAAQIAAAALIDHYGLFGALRKPIDLLRAAGLATMIAGVVIAQIAASGAKAPPHQD